MEVTSSEIEGVFIISPKVFGDDRGYFFESFNERKFEELVGERVSFVQDNQSKSNKGVLRGLHFQEPPFSQGKLVRVIQGSVLDVVVDIRKKSRTYGQHFAVVLDTVKHQMLWVPEGMAHGFLSLEDNTIFSYKCTNYYHPESEGCICWSDQDLNINWGIKNPIISEKDKYGIEFRNFNTLF